MAMLSHAPLDKAIEKSNIWLGRQTIDSFLEVADRLLVRFLYPSKMPYQDIQGLLDNQGRLFEAAKQLASEKKLPMPDVVVAMWVLEQLRGETLPEWRALFESPTRTWIKNMIAPEPHRSAGLYWAEQVGWADGQTSGQAPRIEILRMYHYTHLIYYATGYGIAPIASSSMAEEVASLRENWRKYTDNADLTAEVLLAFLAIKPLDKALCHDVTDALLKLQQQDGSFMLTDGKKEHHHHATCATWLALSRYRDTLWNTATH